MGKEEIACELTKYLLDTYPPIAFDMKRKEILEQYKWFYEQLIGEQNMDNIGVINGFNDEFIPLRKILDYAEKGAIKFTNGEIKYVGKTKKSKIFHVEINDIGE